MVETYGEEEKETEKERKRGKNREWHCKPKQVHDNSMEQELLRQ